MDIFKIDYKIIDYYGKIPPIKVVINEIKIDSAYQGRIYTQEIHGILENEEKIVFFDNGVLIKPEHQGKQLRLLVSIFSVNNYCVQEGSILGIWREGESIIESPLYSTKIVGRVVSIFEGGYWVIDAGKEMKLILHKEEHKNSKIGQVLELRTCRLDIRRIL